MMSEWNWIFNEEQEKIEASQRRKKKKKKKRYQNGTHQKYQVECK